MRSSQSSLVQGEYEKMSEGNAREFEIGLALAGAASAGAYTAGVGARGIVHETRECVFIE